MTVLEMVRQPSSWTSPLRCQSRNKTRNRICKDLNHLQMILNHWYELQFIRSSISELKWVISQCESTNPGLCIIDTTILSEILGVPPGDWTSQSSYEDWDVQPFLPIDIRCWVYNNIIRLCSLPYSLTLRNSVLNNKQRHITLHAIQMGFFFVNMKRFQKM